MSTIFHESLLHFDIFCLSQVVQLQVVFDLSDNGVGVKADIVDDEELGELFHRGDELTPLVTLISPIQIERIFVAQVQNGIRDLAGLDSVYLMADVDSQLVEPGQIPPFSQFPHKTVDRLLLVLGVQDGQLADILLGLLIELVWDAGEATELGDEIDGPRNCASTSPPLNLVLHEEEWLALMPDVEVVAPAVVVLEVWDFLADGDLHHAPE